MDVVFILYVLAIFVTIPEHETTTISGNTTSSSFIMDRNTSTADVQWFLEPHPSIYISMEESANVQIGYVLLCDSISRTYTVRVNTSDPQVAWVTSKNEFNISCYIETPWGRDLSSRSDSFIEGAFNITIATDLIGRSWLLLTAESNNSSMKDGDTTPNMTRHYSHRRIIVVVREHKAVDTAFEVIVYCFVIINTIGMGCKIDLAVVKDVLRKPIAPGIGFACQYIMMPLIAFGVAKLVPFENAAIGLGIFACGICPGGGASNIYSYLLGGDISLSITMTTISNVGAFAMIPLWMFTLGRQFRDDKLQIDIPFLNIFGTLAMVVLPLFVGIFIKSKSEKVALYIKKALKPASLITVIILFTFGIYANLYIFELFKPRTFLAGCLLPYVGYICGGLSSLIAKQPWYRVKTIAIETGVQNVMVAYLMLTRALPPPDGDLAAVGPAASACMTPLPLFVITVFYMIYLKCTNQKRPGAKADENGVQKESDFKNGHKPDQLSVKNGTIIEEDEEGEDDLEGQELVAMTTTPSF